MGIPILLRWHLYIESGPWSLYWRWPQSDWANNRMGCGTRYRTTGGTLIQWRSFKVMSGCKVLPQFEQKFIANTMVCQIINSLMNCDKIVSYHLAWWHSAITWTPEPMLICKVVWHLPESNFTVSVHATVLYNEFETYTVEWVKI